MQDCTALEEIWKRSYAARPSVRHESGRFSNWGNLTLPLHFNAEGEQFENAQFSVFNYTEETWKRWPWVSACSTSRNTGTRNTEHRSTETSEHRNITEHSGTSKNPEHPPKIRSTPKTRNTPKKTRTTPQKSRNTPRKSGKPPRKPETTIKKTWNTPQKPEISSRVFWRKMFYKILP